MSHSQTITKCSIFQLINYLILHWNGTKRNQSHTFCPLLLPEGVFISNHIKFSFFCREPYTDTTSIWDWNYLQILKNAGSYSRYFKMKCQKTIASYVTKDNYFMFLFGKSLMPLIRLSLYGWKRSPRE